MDSTGWRHAQCGSLQSGTSQPDGFFKRIRTKTGRRDADWVGASLCEGVLEIEGVRQVVRGCARVNGCRSSSLAGLCIRKDVIFGNTDASHPPFSRCVLCMLTPLKQCGAIFSTPQNTYSPVRTRPYPCKLATSAVFVFQPKERVLHPRGSASRNHRGEHHGGGS